MLLSGLSLLTTILTVLISTSASTETWREPTDLERVRYELWPGLVHFVEKKSSGGGAGLPKIRVNPWVRVSRLGDYPEYSD